MTDKKQTGGFFQGFANAAMGLGLLLGILWGGVWLAHQAGMSITPMPIKLLQSAAGLVIIGWCLRFLLTARSLKSH